MSDHPVPESDDIGNDDEESQLSDSVFLLTPEFDIYQRVEPEAFIDFVQRVDRAINEEFANHPKGEGVELQVACALLPSRKKLVEGRIEPENAASRHVERLAQVIDRLQVPEVSDGPVAFFRRCVLSGGLNPSPGFGLPFFQFLRHPGMLLLDEVLMEAGRVKAGSQSFWGKMPLPPAETLHYVVVKPPVESLWGRIVGLFRKRKGPIRTMEQEDILSNLRKRLDRPVTIRNGRMAICY
jgi:hypothetical protein